MTVEDKLLELSPLLSGTVEEHLLSSSMNAVYVDHHNAETIEEIYTADVVDTYEANIVEEIYTATFIDDTPTADLDDTIPTGEIVCP